MLRIISGSLRNRKILQPDLKITRPTTDKVREAVFSSLQFKIVGKNFLDLFSGSGAIAIEAFSRGAKKVVAVEKNREAFHIVKTNLDTLNISNQIEAIHSDALVFLTKNQSKFDFIYLDTPYLDYQLMNDVLALIMQQKILNDDGEIIVETNKITEVKVPLGFKIYKTKRYGKVDILYLCYE
ncbi:16S rRNA (guanine966-N2)-methyltransferase [Mycoplasmopsis mustelae]|uniref:16S rRNA (Guanine966-N2)-methyltransferase n=1 Tax=Mycoplasmopsis mustelae TaxID=171289 RepID=A0A4R7UBX5_9BACT|nr:16S rRNA (guanine(966)-N(2))-methyltransferase RsmD [Mycoplasmopsis mustelae]TDV23065.1 16S rRNA (guanine966-N2)-methyltransferase [Mycoplasmopsis mustelae]